MVRAPPVAARARAAPARPRLGRGAPARALGGDGLRARRLRAPGGVAGPRRGGRGPRVALRPVHVLLRRARRASARDGRRVGTLVGRGRPPSALLPAALLVHSLARLPGLGELAPPHAPRERRALRRRRAGGRPLLP